MGGLAFLRNFSVFLLFSLVSASVFAQTVYSVNVSTFDDAAEPADPGTFRVSVSPTIPVGVYMDIYACLDVQGGSATEGVDYVEIENFNESCPMGQYPVFFSDQTPLFDEITVSVLDDSDYEGNETVILGVASVNGGCDGCDPSTYVAGSSATMNIADDETPPVNYTVNLAAGAGAAEPSTDGYFVATVSPIPPVDFDGTVVACVDVTGVTATEGEDFEAIGYSQEGCPSDTHEVWFRDGEWSFDIPINVLDDPDYEGNETVTVGVTSATVWSTNDTASAGTTATLNIEDDDDYATYNSGYDSLNADIDNFNARADRGDFATLDQFNRERNQLINRQDELNALYDTIEANVATYDGLVVQLEDLNATISELNQSINIEPRNQDGI